MFDDSEWQKRETPYYKLGKPLKFRIEFLIALWHLYHHLSMFVVHRITFLDQNVPHHLHKIQIRFLDTLKLSGYINHKHLKYIYA